MFQNANGEWKEYIYLLPSYYKHQAFILVFKFLSFYLYTTAASPKAVVSGCIDTCTSHE
jgi:hypothetical protein